MVSSMVFEKRLENRISSKRTQIILFQMFAISLIINNPNTKKVCIVSLKSCSGSQFLRDNHCAVPMLLDPFSALASIGMYLFMFTHLHNYECAIHSLVSCFFHVIYFDIFFYQFFFNLAVLNDFFNSFNTLLTRHNRTFQTSQLYKQLQPATLNVYLCAVE